VRRDWDCSTDGVRQASDIDPILVNVCCEGGASEDVKLVLPEQDKLEKILRISDHPHANRGLHANARRGEDDVFLGLIEEERACEGLDVAFLGSSDDMLEMSGHGRIGRGEDYFLVF
jgi:hypothetical protein